MKEALHKLPETNSSRPKIIVPIAYASKEEILNAAKTFEHLPADICEWRADCYEGIDDLSNTLALVKQIKKELGQTPLLVTMRTKKEGGKKDLSAREYEDFYSAVLDARLADLIDVELFCGDVSFDRLISKAHENGILVIASSHDFEKTPDESEIIQRLCLMQEKGADYLKIAVMPQNEQDVLDFMNAVKKMNRLYAKKPVVAMSMGQTGMISRIAGGLFGSAMSFGSFGKASAPGQLDAFDLAKILDLLYPQTAD